MSDRVIKRAAVIGLGRFGRAVARTLSELGVDVLAIDRELRFVEMVKNEVALAVCVDATQESALEELDVAKVDLLVIGAGFAGLVGAWQASLQGLKVRLISKGWGSDHWGSGAIGVIGYTALMVVDLIWVRVLLAVVAVSVTIHLLRMKTLPRASRPLDRGLETTAATKDEPTDDQQVTDIGERLDERGVAVVTQEALE